MDTKEDFAIEIHDDGSKELDAGLRPLDHYKQVINFSLFSLPATRKCKES
jgi:hypothetical protein